MRLLISACASLPTEPSGPGLPDLCAARARWLVMRRSSLSIHARVTRSRMIASCAGESAPGLRRCQSSTTCEIAPAPFFLAPMPPIATRSFIRVVIATRQPWPSLPSMFACGMRTLSKNTSLNSASPVIW